jgi:hypothetical protein
MIDSFSLLPNKVLNETGIKGLEVWPELGQDFVLNQFYRVFQSAEGWLGERYVILWTKAQVLAFNDEDLLVYPSKYKFFASDGGGNKFGFFVQEHDLFFVAAPNLGSEDDIRVLGGWSDFIKAVQTANYI